MYMQIVCEILYVYVCVYICDHQVAAVDDHWTPTFH